MALVGVDETLLYVLVLAVPGLMLATGIVAMYGLMGRAARAAFAAKLRKRPFLISPGPDGIAIAPKVKRTESGTWKTKFQTFIPSKQTVWNLYGTACAVGYALTAFTVHPELAVRIAALRAAGFSRGGTSTAELVSRKYREQLEAAKTQEEVVAIQKKMEAEIAQKLEPGDNVEDYLLKISIGELRRKEAELRQGIMVLQQQISQLWTKSEPQRSVLSDRKASEEAKSEAMKSMAPVLEEKAKLEAELAAKQGELQEIMTKSYAVLKELPVRYVEEQDAKGHITGGKFVADLLLPLEEYQSFLPFDANPALIKVAEDAGVNAEIAERGKDASKTFMTMAGVAVVIIAIAVLIYMAISAAGK